MTEQEAKAVLARMSYKPGHTFSLDGGHVSLHAPEQPNVVPGLKPVTLTFHARVPYWTLTEARFVLAVRTIVEQAERHEMNEWLHLDGVPLVTPEHR